jgi:glycosyltransferase involved in cell wall biosynthesis
MSGKSTGTPRLSELKVIEVGVLAGGPESLLAKYLRQRVKSFTFIENLHTRYYQTGMDLLHVSHYRNGKLERTFKAGKNLRFLLKWRKTRRILYYTLVMSGILLSVLRLRTRYDLFIAIDSPYPFSGLVLRKLRLAQKAFSIIGDHFPRQKRGNLGAFFSWFYGYSDKLAQNKSDAVWYFTSRLLDINRDEGVIRNDFVPRLVVPIGIDLEMSRNEPEDNRERNSIGYIGRLNDEIGLELVLEAIGEVVNTIPGVTLKIIGSGDNEQTLKAMVHEKGLDNNVIFYGFMSDRDKAKAILSRCAASIAPYVPGIAYSIQYTDPAKVKEYIECGTPVIMTRIPGLATEIHEKKAGVAVDYNLEEMTDAILKLLTDDELWHEYRKNIGQLAERYDYVKLYDEAFITSGIGL